jgi:hypothetical protein
MDTASWFAVVTGTIGTITGTAGAVLGYKGYRRSQEMKALDLRLELRKAEVDYRRSVGELPELLRQARQSRQAVLAGLGTLHTGAFKAWVEQWEKDNATAKAMGETLPMDPSDQPELSPSARGSIDEVHVTPREVLRAALMANAPGLIVSHNHPSGDPDPSPADEAFTKRLAAAATILGLDLLDHIVIGHGRYVSFKEAGLMA